MKNAGTRRYDLFGRLVAKKCNRCQEWLDVSLFHYRSGVVEGLSAWCKNCHSIRNKERYTPQNKEHSLKRNYGISQAEWDERFRLQGKRCASCGGETPGSTKGWHTDHVHGTRIVRGILCNGCNLAAGFLRDSPERAESLAAYLRKSYV